MFKSNSAVQSSYRVEFKSKSSPSRRIIVNIIKLSEENDSVKPMHSKNHETMLMEFPKFSIRIASSAIEVSATMIYTVPYDNLHLKSFKYSTNGN